MQETPSCPKCRRPLRNAVLGEVCSVCLLQTLADATLPLMADSPGDSSSPGGASLGRYTLLRELGRGGMGTVHQARQKGLDRIVAIKIIRSGWFSDSSQVRRFHLEMETISKLDHPNIIPVYEAGECDGWHFYTMRYAQGGTLAQELARPDFKPSQSQAARLVAAITRAVQHAHDRGVLHRDLKPGNILLEGGGEPLVSDFGLAKVIGSDSELTIPGAILGTPSYMAPEQAAGDRSELTVAADIYSLGAILYHVLAGRPPFSGDHVLEILRQVREEDPTPVRHFRRVDRDLEAVCLKCLHKNPKRRYSSAEALASDLERWLRREPVQARPSRRSERVLKWGRRHPTKAVLCGMALLAAAAFPILVSLHERELKLERDQAVREWARAEATTVRLQLERAEDYFSAKRPDLALPIMALVLRDSPSNPIAADRIVSALTQRRYASPACEPLLHPASPYSAEFSKDGQWIVTGCEDGSARVWDSETGVLLKVLAGHSAAIPSAIFNPDGDLVLTVSHDLTARLWNWRSGSVLAGPLTHLSHVVQGLFTEDGAIAATVGLDQTVRIWNGTNGAPIATLEHPDQVRHAAFNTAGNRLATACQDGIVRIWNLPEGRLLSLTSGRQPVNVVGFSPEGKLLLSGSDEGTLRIWNPASGEDDRELFTLKDRIIRARFSPDGRHVVSGSQSGEVRVVALQTGVSEIKIEAGEDWLRDLQFSPDGRMLLTASADHTARLWDTRDGSALIEPIRHPRQVFAARFHPLGARLVTVCDDHCAYVWQLRQEDFRPRFALQHGGEVNCAKFSPGGKALVTGSRDGVVKLWDPVSGTPMAPVIELGSEVFCLAFSPDERFFAAGTRDGRARVWETESGKPASEMFQHDGPVESLDFDPTGRLLATAGGSAARVWNWPEGRQIIEPLPGATMRVVHFSPDGTRLVTGDSTGEMRVWNALTGRPVTPPFRHQAWIYDVVFSPDGSRIASASLDTTARLWSAFTGEPLTPPLLHGSQVRRVSFSHDGRRLATACLDKAARIWSAETGAPLTPMMRHQGHVTAADFNREGAKLLTVSYDRTARIWDATTGHALGEPLPHSREVIYGEFSPDGRLVVTACADGVARLWEVPDFPYPVPSWLPRLAEAVAGHRLHQSGTTEIVGTAGLLDLIRERANASEADAWSRWARSLFSEPKLSEVIQPP